MKMDAESFKKFKPFIIGGVVLGVVGFVISKNSASQVVATVAPDPNATAVTDQSASALTDALNTTLSQKLSDMVTQTNTAFNQQKSYYDNLTGALQKQNATEDTSISALTAQLHNMQSKAPTPSTPKKTTPTKSSTPVKKPVNKFTQTLRMGNKGNQVTMLQNLLIYHGFKIKADGIFGTGTKNALMAYQKKNHLTADGIMGKQTIAKL